VIDCKFHMYLYIFIYYCSLHRNVMSHLNKMWLSINHSITRTYSLIRSIDRELVNGTKNDIYKQAAVLTADCYSRHVNTLIPTLFQSKLFNVGVPTLHVPETNAELAISAKKTISTMLATIPVIHETHWYVNSLCSFFPFAQWTLWRTVKIHRRFFHSFYWLKAGRYRLVFSFQDNILYASPCAKFHVQISSWTKRFKEVHRHYRGADNSLADPGRKQATATEDFDFDISYL